MLNVSPNLNSANAVCIVSIMKSGTHWLRYLFANYQKLVGADDYLSAPAATYEELQAIYSPTDRRLALREGRDAVAGSIYPMYGIESIFWQHVDPNLAEFNGKMVFIYRNPLDCAVSRYFYDKQRWADQGRDVSTIGATMRWSIEWYARSMRTMLDLMKVNPKIVSVTYEELKLCPLSALGNVFRWVGLPYHADKLARAIEISDAKHVRKEEEQRKEPIVGPTTTGYFVRDSSVGQWRQHLRDEDIQLAKKTLHRFGLDLDTFMLTLPDCRPAITANSSSSIAS